MNDRLARNVTSAAVVFAMAGGPVATAQDCQQDWFGFGATFTGLSTVVPVVLSLETFDLDGPGPAPEVLYAGGAFSGEPVLGDDGILFGHAIRQWNGAEWVVLGEDLLPGDGGIGPRVYAMSVVDHDGDGPAPRVLYASGWLSTNEDPQGWNVAAWDGQRWSTPGGGIAGGAFPHVVFDSASIDPDGAGPAGEWLVTAGRAGITAYDGQSWATLLEGDPVIWYAVESFDDDGDPSTPALLAAGNESGVSLWDGASWTQLGGPSLTSTARALSVYDADGDGPALPRLIARGSVWTGSEWTALSGSDGVSVSGFQVTATVVEDGHPVPVLYGAKLRDEHLYRWDGEVWIAIPAFSNPTSNLYYTDPMAMIGVSKDSDVYPSGVYIGGIFEELGGKLARSLGLRACETPSRACIGDTNADLRVNFPDLTAVLRDWGRDAPITDLNENGRVEFGDILGVLTTWGNDCIPIEGGSAARGLEAVPDLDGDGEISFAETTAYLETR